MALTSPRSASTETEKRRFLPPLFESQLATSESESGPIVFRKESLVPFAALVIVSINIAYAQTPSRRAIVVDERISALRESPERGSENQAMTASRKSRG
jgi:hypothetical protein